MARIFPRYFLFVKLIACSVIFVPSVVRAQITAKVTNDSLSSSFNRFNYHLKLAEKKWTSSLVEDSAYSDVLNTLRRVHFNSSRISPFNLGDSSTDLQFKLRLAQDFNNYIDLLNESLNNGKIKDAKLAVSFIDGDIISKLNSKLGSQRITSKLINVKVRVVDDKTKNEVSGIKVFVKPELTVHDRFIEEFNRLTNNAEQKIMPGRKIFWIVKDNVTLDRKTVTIRSENDSVLVDFYLKN